MRPPSRCKLLRCECHEGVEGPLMQAVVGTTGGLATALGSVDAGVPFAGGEREKDVGRKRVERKKLS